MVTRQIRVSGRVQGVGYRDALIREAERRGIRGWVRNRADGIVEALLQGSADAVDALIEWAKKGPPASRVDQVSVAAAQAQFDRTYERFERWPSL